MGLRAADIGSRTARGHASLRLDRKALYYTIDAILASFLLIGALLVLSSNGMNERKTEQRMFISQDLLASLSELRIGELNNSFIDAEIANGNITDLNKKVIDQMADYWAMNSSGKATTLLEIVTNSTMSMRSGLRLTLADEELLFRNYSTKDHLVVSSRMISGVEKSKPLSGSSGSAYLKKIRNKKTSSYAYFGGFIGQGNLTFFIDDLPADFSPEKVVSIYLEGDFGANFSFYINNNACMFNATKQEYALNSSLEINSWEMLACNQSLVASRNNFTIVFNSSFDKAYIAGGFLRINYRTDVLQGNITLGSGRYYFPEVKGVANIYDSFYIPGNLTTMDVLLHFKSQQSTYLTIGERYVEIPSTGADQVVALNDSYLKSLGFDYAKLSRNTVPIRFASYNATVDVITTGNADIILITDFSGSMKKAVDSWTEGTGKTDCTELYGYSDARKTHLAKCVDNELIDVVMNGTVVNNTGNRLWPVFLHSNIIDSYDNPTDRDAIKGYVTTYGPQGKDQTCLACAINQAYNYFVQYSNSNRTKFIVLMTDGAPTHCAQGSCASNSTVYGAQQCSGFCDTNGQSGCGGTITGCAASDASCQGAENNARYSAQRAVNDLNVTFYTVGFGLIEDCNRTAQLLHDIASMHNGTYMHSKNVSELRIIYYNISQDILTRVVQTNQSVKSPGNITLSTLYGDSYINYTFDPIVQSIVPGKITSIMQVQLPNCTTTVYLPTGIDILDAKVFSYSGTHWSDVLAVNDETVFNLSGYYVPYYRLGDPSIIQLPVDKLHSGNNVIHVETGDSPDNRTNCSANNHFIYTALVSSATSRTDVKAKQEGCIWTVAYDDGDVANITVPADYAGTKACSYQPGNMSWDDDDTYDAAVFALFRQLDPDNSGRILVNINKLDLEVVTTIVGGLPYMWGPSVLRAEVWQ